MASAGGWRGLKAGVGEITGDGWSAVLAGSMGLRQGAALPCNTIRCISRHGGVLQNESAVERFSDNLRSGVPVTSTCQYRM